MKIILITGANGYIGSYLMENIQTKGYEVRGIDKKSSLKINKLDILNTKLLIRYLISIKPSVIIHCAAIKDLEECESKKELSFKTNVLSTEIIASYAKRFKSKVIYISSDVVFDGKAGKFTINDSVNPINWYGKTKAFSEILVKNIPKSVIIRTALVIGPLNTKSKEGLDLELKNRIPKNQTLLPHFIFQKLKNKQAVYLSPDTISNPTPVELLNMSINKIIKEDLSGLFHVAGPDSVSRYELGLKIAKLFHFDKKLIKKIDINFTLRPKNISMNVTKSFRSLSIKENSWKLDNYLPSLFR